MILIDSNIPMYLVGAAHPHQADAQRLLERFTIDNRRLVSDVEVLQEILHRYVAIDRRDAIQPAFDALFGVVDHILPITVETLQSARDIVLGSPAPSARDALHVAVMRQHDIQEILSFDRGFDSIPGIRRLGV